MLIRNAELEIEGERRVADVRLDGRQISQVAPRLEARRGLREIDAHGGALLPAIHDHHIHLLALAAALQSVACGPPDVRSGDELAAALRSAPGAWVRGVGYHESVAGELDRHALDRWVPGRRVRVQHRSGAAWLLSSAALEALGITPEAHDLPEGVERDARGHPTGRLFRLDDWLRGRLPEREFPRLDDASRRLARSGVASVTDATPTNDSTTLAKLLDERRAGRLMQRVVLMGGDDLGIVNAEGFSRGAYKIVLDERSLPEPDALAARVEIAHDAGLSVAIHCVTRAELVLAAYALEAAKAGPTDRIEHASIAPPELVTWLAQLGVTVVTQPGFLFERGDAYLRDVGDRDRAWLYRCRGFDEANVPLGAGTDAPYSEPDPWRAMQAAVDRRSELGAFVGKTEAVLPERALALFTTPAESPGGAPRRVEAGAPADLMLLDRPWREARDALSSEHVSLTIGDGRVLWTRESEIPPTT